MGAHQFSARNRLKVLFVSVDGITVAQYPNGWYAATRGRRVINQARATTPQEEREIIKGLIDTSR